MKKFLKAILLLVALLFPSQVVTAAINEIQVTDADTVWTPDLITASSDVTDSTDAPPQTFTEASVSHADTVWSPSLTLASSVTDSTDAPPQDLSEAFVSHADTVWTPESEGFTPSENQPPNPSALLSQYKTDGTEIPVGGTTDESTVILKGVVNDPDDDQVKLQIELRRLDEYGGSFTGEYTQEGEWISSGSEVGVTVFGLVPDTYHWQARAVDKRGATSDWASFGNNNISETDFTVDTFTAGTIDISVFDSPDPFNPYLGEINTVAVTNEGKNPCGLVRLLIEGTNRTWEWENLVAGGNVQTVWDGKDGTGNIVSAGVYDYTATCYQEWRDGHGVGFSDTETGTITVLGAPENQRPNLPTLLSQYKTDGTEIPVGNVVDESAVVFKGEVSDSDGDKVKLEIELRRLDEYEGQFQNEPTPETTGDLVNSGTEVNITRSSLVDGEYHWQARAVDEHDAKSGWVEFGENDISDVDFKRLPPVFLVHGFQPFGGFNPVGIWEDMGENLTGIRKEEQVANNVPGYSFWKLGKRSGDGLTVYVSDYSRATTGPILNDIRLYAYNLAEEIQAIKANENVNKVDIVSHSMGGLVARAYIENGDFSDNLYGTMYKSDVRKLVTLGTPNHGAMLAALSKYIDPDKCKNEVSDISPCQMRPQSPFLNTLNHGCETCTIGEDRINKEAEYVTIAGTDDNLVTTESAKLDGVPYYAFPVNHTGLRISDFVGDLVKNILSDQNIIVNRAIGYAVIVVGEGGWRERLVMNYNANNTYRVLRNLGFDDEHIFYLSSNRPQDVDNDGDDEVDAVSSAENFNKAMEWVRQGVGESVPFILYMHGHVSRGKGCPDHFFFELGGNDTLTPFGLDISLSTLPSGTPMLIAIDTCYSGIFITDSMGNISGPKRVIVTSAHDDKKTLPYLNRFSYKFWRHLQSGENVREAFVGAGCVKHSWLDDNGDTIGHPPNSLENDGDLAEDMWIGIPDTENIGLKPFVVLEPFSPVDVQVYDSQGNITGLVNGEIKEEIPNSFYDVENKIVVIFEATDEYNYKVVGADTGTYGLKITSNKIGETTTFNATDIPTSPGEVHEYTIDWDVLSQGGEGAILKIDFDGDGEFDETTTAGNSLDMGAKLETQIAIIEMVYGGVDILDAVTGEAGDGTLPLLLSELKEVIIDLEGYTPEGKMSFGEKRKLKMRFKFLETAGNEYQGKSINTTFKFEAIQEE